jgi:sugar phosphate isomerase/epimerase
MDRKTFLRLSAGAALTGTVYVAACRGEEEEAPGGLDAPVGQRTLPAIGLQLYTIRALTGVDLAGALRSVAEAGYTEVEFWDYFDHAPTDVAAMVRDVGLDPVSSHVDLEDLRSGWGEVVDRARTIGHRYVVVPWLAEEERTPDGYRRLAEELNTYGARFSDAGISLGYHNHEFEFQPLSDGSRGFDLLLAETDPDVVTFELDFFWAATAGANIPGYMDNHAGRFSLCHVKDRDPQGRMVDVGMGTLDWGRYFGYARSAGIQHFFVEHDEPRDPLQTIRRSQVFLEALTF